MEQTVGNYIKAYYGQIEKDLQELVGKGLLLDDFCFMKGTPSEELQSKAILYWCLPTAGGFLLDERWLMLKEDMPNETDS